jgi:hypothetical protein
MDAKVYKKFINHVAFPLLSPWSFNFLFFRARNSQTHNSLIYLLTRSLPSSPTSKKNEEKEEESPQSCIKVQ